MAKAIIKRGIFETFCRQCRSKFSYEYPDTFDHTTTDYQGGRDVDRVVECPVCKHNVPHRLGVGNTA